jgi:hypothetical protein
VLDLIGRRPAVRAATLAAEVGRETLNFKQDVRKLKELGSRKASKSVTGCRRAAVPCSVGSGMPGRSDTLAHEPDIRS